MPYEPIVTVDRLAVGSEHVEPERLGVQPSELEDVPDLDAAGDLQRRAARRARVPVAHVGDVDHAVGREVAPGDEVDDVPAGLRRRR